MTDYPGVLAFQCMAGGLPAPEREVKFHAKRRWRLDLVFRDAMLAVECDGAVWTNGRHSRGAGVTADTEKYAEAMCAGFRVLRVTSDQVTNGQAFLWIERLLSSKISGAADESLVARPLTDAVSGD